MARHRFGGDTASWATNLGADATTPGGVPAKVALFVPGAVVIFYNRAEGGSRYTELADLNGTTIDSVTCNERGFWPEFDGPDGVWTMYADANGGDGPRYRVQATDLGAAVDSAQSTADEALNSATTAELAPIFLYYNDAAGAYPDRPSGGAPVWFVGPVKPPIGGTGAINGLDLHIGP